MPTSFLSRRSFLSTASLASASPLFWTPGMAAQMPMPKSVDPTSKALDTYVAAFMPAMNAPGMVLGMTDKEKTLRSVGYGYANVDQKVATTPDHLFQIGSITKSFVALVLLQLREEGKLDLHRPVLEYLPELPIVTEFGPITTHDLLTHTSGLPNCHGPFLTGPSARLIQGFKPGEHFFYCNAGFDILGLLAQKLDARPWRVLVADRILGPLEMTASRGVITNADRDRCATGYAPYFDDQAYPRQGKLAPAPVIVTDSTAGCIVSNPSDMARYLRMLLNRGMGPHRRIVSEESFALMSTPYIKAEEFSPTASYGYGIGVDTLDGHKILRHTGGMVAFASSIHVDLDGGVACFASINAMQGYRPRAVTEYAVRLARAQKESKPLPPAPSIADPMAIKNAADFTGTFTAPNGNKLTFAAEGDRLFLTHDSTMADSTKLPLQSEEDDTFLSTRPQDHASYAFVFGRAELPKNTAADTAADKDLKPSVPPPVIELSYGPDWYTAAAYAGKTDFTPPADSALYTGTYRSDSAWGGSVDVYVSKGGLVADGAALKRIGGSLFRLGDDSWSPDTVEFLQLFEGKARIVKIGGMDYWRVDVG